MTQLIESLTYSSRVEHTQAKSGLSVNIGYAVNTIAALLAIINSGEPGDANYVQRAAGIVFEPEDRGGRHHRCNLAMAGRGSAATNIEESLYLVVPTDHRSAHGVNPATQISGLELHKAADLVWTLGTGTIDSAVGGRTDHKHAASVAITPTGLLLAQTKVEIVGVNEINRVALATVYDTGSAIGLIRLIGLPGSSAASAGVGRHQRWK